MVSNWSLKLSTPVVRTPKERACSHSVSSSESGASSDRKAMFSAVLTAIGCWWRNRSALAPNFWRAYRSRFRQACWLRHCSKSVPSGRRRAAARAAWSASAKSNSVAKALHSAKRFLARSNQRKARRSRTCMVPNRYETVPSGAVACQSADCFFCAFSPVRRFNVPFLAAFAGKTALLVWNFGR
jgi:hypothetical protein